MGILGQIQPQFIIPTPPTPQPRHASGGGPGGGMPGTGVMDMISKMGGGAPGAVPGAGSQGGFDPSQIAQLLMMFGG